MKPRDYCCCAIPTANAGIYAVLTEQLVLGILLGALSMATPSSLVFVLLIRVVTENVPPSRRCGNPKFCAMGLWYCLFRGWGRSNSWLHRGGKGAGHRPIVCQL